MNLNVVLYTLGSGRMQIAFGWTLLEYKLMAPSEPAQGGLSTALDNALNRVIDVIGPSLASYMYAIPTNPLVVVVHWGM